MGTNNDKNQAGAVAVRGPGWPSIWSEDFDRLFARAFHRPLLHSRLLPDATKGGAWIPALDAFEREGKTVIRVDLPGMKREDVQVTVEKDMLFLRGHREEEQEVKEGDYYCSERATGDFSRGITLPEGVQADQVKATYHDGVLEVVVPKVPPPESKGVQVPIK